MLYPMVILATMATVIASQAVISGVFSVTRQAAQLSYCPRIAIRHTSEQAIGQIYFIPDQDAIAELGKTGFWRLAVKPGKPVTFGWIDNCLVRGMPGNPRSLAVYHTNSSGVLSSLSWPTGWWGLPNDCAGVAPGDTVE